MADRNPDQLNDFQRRIGVGSVNYALQRTGPTRTRPVVTEEGPSRGSVGGVQIDHKDGRMDARVRPPTVQHSLSTFAPQENR